MPQEDFSNNGRDTFDPLKQYIGVRLKKGVPLLDRDWNELEDIRRYFERMLRLHYVGEGVPDIDGFQIRAPTFRAPNDFLIGAGRCMVNGYDVENEREILYSEQPHDVAPLPPAGQNDEMIVYIQSSITRIGSADDPALRNSQDINLETSLRDKLNWRVAVTRHPRLPPVDAYPLAVIRRPAGTTQITDDMIFNLRRTRLNLANVVDTADDLRTRVEAIEDRIDEIQLEVVRIKEQLGRLFWDVNIESSVSQANFGSNVRITAIITDGLGQPVHGARLSFSTDWGSLDPATALTGTNGRASIDLVGVYAETPPPRSDISQFQGLLEKVNLATLTNPGVIQYNQIKFQPQEMALLSKYSPPGLLSNLSLDLPTGAIVAVPARRTATVTVHAKEGAGAIVRGVGSIQVHFGLWVRDWARTKIVDVISKVDVGARIGDIMRQGIEGGSFQAGKIATELLPKTLQDINDDTQVKFKASVLADLTTPDTELSQTGILGQIIAQEATAAVGQKTNQAIVSQLDQFTVDPGVPLDSAGAKAAKTAIVQSSSQIAAGFSQNQKQLFSSTRFGG